MQDFVGVLRWKSWQTVWVNIVDIRVSMVWLCLICSKSHFKCRWYLNCLHDDVIKWKHFPRYWPFVRRIHRSPVNSLHKGQWRGALMFTLICVWINGCVNNRAAGDLGRYCAHYGVTVMITSPAANPAPIGEHHSTDCKIRNVFLRIYLVKFHNSFLCTTLSKWSTNSRQI